ncbi:MULTISPECIES: dTDP-4-dehydrorhamnose reductase [Weeksella]|uniref:dTDP-4-dehydrorhamnose reductase n=1 Tax=Weeksella virosa (strain ATCC 43766 / DSM 16922 / JCM 21250 / CCUG 30538 / CDC 9751 / IAM 14551 / NBRC 16016 / NCTC 11634 / CL345/78) TaxID=865938 RepID=F0P2H3_WEEVC|nr:MULTISPECIES: dTDP-4-dehydrorhamnose reductase [Weeksella]ADX67812.1 dTDP-4-dehydrorhamnose reductase [Weeksella virosa DSM 16922]MDK7374101.1 dTDP-4-dehydrorhamnose reductase [Weeksella virosa]MDK7674413.1 dTDP-4-dehydrorhamnose reductase [Weeksella virosa]OFM82783.1 NAD(P)-dependent oxidoreductase [Weeksella sp. HMSC059D05]SUP54115.1 dTDP-4-dehydrorhamnose reductase [Weeksella virosa]
MKKILVTGANGQLAQAIESIEKSTKKIQFIFKTANELDITNRTNLLHHFDKNIYNGVINTAAYTAVDLAESEEKKAYAVNALGVENLARVTKRQNIPLLHLSTDYVFSGNDNHPQKEDDPCDPQNIYGKTKLAGEQLALQTNPKTIIIRTAWLYSRFGNNFVKTMLRLFEQKKEINVINDQIGSPTNAIDLAKALVQIIESDVPQYGVFHYSNEGECSWYDFAQAIKKYTNSSIEIHPIATKDYPTAAKRPAFSLLDKTKIKQVYGLKIPKWEDSLRSEINEMY